MTDYLIPLILIGVSLVALWKKQDVYGALTEGGLEGLKLLAHIAPALVMLLTAVHMLRASGAIDLLCRLCRPVTSFSASPPSCCP